MSEHKPKRDTPGDRVRREEEMQATIDRLRKALIEGSDICYDILGRERVSQALAEQITAWMQKVDTIVDENQPHEN